MDPVVTKLLIYWVLFGVSNILLGASIMMLWTGKLPNGRRVHPVISTSILVIGLTMMLRYGVPDLLKQTLETLF